jgi:hypothetical protein
MTAATLAIQRIHPRMAIMLTLLLAAVAVAAVAAAAFHGVPVHHGAMSFDGPKSKMSFD